MRHVTRDIDPADAHDLLERVPRACIAFATDHGPESQPVILVWREDQYLVGIPDHVIYQPRDGQEVVLLVDEGVHFFDLRAIYLRGQAQPTDPPPDVPKGHIWIEVIPTKTVAWDYGMLREVADES